MTRPATKAELSLLRSLRTVKGRRENDLFLVEGVRLCAELAESSVRTEFTLVADSIAADASMRPLLERFARKGVPIFSAREDFVRRVSDTTHSQGILAAARWRPVAPADLPRRRGVVFLALDAVADPGNVGTVIRTAAWCAVDGVLLGEGCADLLNPKTVRATMGGLFHVPVCSRVGLSEELAHLKASGFHVAAAATDGSPDWRGWRGSGSIALVLGNEARGLSAPVRELADRLVAVPLRGKGESLNVAMTASILLSVLL